MQTLTGSSNLLESGMDTLRGLSAGFVGNQTSRLSDGSPTVGALLEHGAVKLHRLFAPEHGAFGTFDSEVPDLTDHSSGLAVRSLYGATRKPTAEMLDGIDVLLFELQDIGARFYTYASTLGLCLEACVENDVRMIVLDRPNPITGLHPEGPVADADDLSFTAYHPVPIRHGLTLGELATLYCLERGYPPEALTVIPCARWTRGMWADQTGIKWVNPSPAMRSLEAATLYPGVCLLEQTNISVGRGTDTPFQMVGSPFVNGGLIAERLNEICRDTVRFSPTSFAPTSGPYAGELCSGVRIAVIDRDRLSPAHVGIALVATLRDMYGQHFNLDGVARLMANRATMRLLSAGAGVDDVTAAWANDLDDWQKRAERVRLYPEESQSN